VDGQLTDAIWANASRIQFAPAGSPDRPMTLALAQSGTIRFAGLTISDPAIEDTDEVRLYLDINNNQGDPDSADRLFIIRRDGTASVQPGVGTNNDLLTWEANASQTVAVGVAELDGAWAAEILLEDAVLGPMANPIGLMLQITDGVAVISWPEGADPFVASGWDEIANPGCP